MARFALRNTMTGLANLGHQVQNPLDVGLEETHLLRWHKLPVPAVK